MLSEGSVGGVVGSNGGLKAKAKTEELWKGQGDVKKAKENVALKDMKEQKANPSDGLQTPPALPPPSASFSPLFPHSTRG